LDDKVYNFDIQFEISLFRYSCESDLAKTVHDPSNFGIDSSVELAYPLQEDVECFCDSSVESWSEQEKYIYKFLRLDFMTCRSESSPQSSI